MRVRHVMILTMVSALLVLANPVWAEEGVVKEFIDNVPLLKEKFFLSTIQYYIVLLLFVLALIGAGMWGLGKMFASKGSEGADMYLRGKNLAFISLALIFFVGILPQLIIFLLKASGTQNPPEIPTFGGN